MGTDSDRSTGKNTEDMLIRLRPGQHDEIIAWKDRLRSEYGAIQREAIKALQFWIEHGEGQQLPERPPPANSNIDDLKRIIANALDSVPSRDEIRQIVEVVVNTALADLELSGAADSPHEAESRLAADTLNFMIAGLNDDEGEYDDDDT